jgi:hypothetical protein
MRHKQTKLLFAQFAVTASLFFLRLDDHFTSPTSRDKPPKKNTATLILIVEEPL